jgi:hypothetical protein
MAMPPARLLGHLHLSVGALVGTVARAFAASPGAAALDNRYIAPRARHRPVGCPPQVRRHTQSLDQAHLNGVFSPNPCFFLRTCPARPIRAHACPGITRRLCGWLNASGTQDLRALRLWQSCRQWRAQPWSCMDAAPGCRLQRRSSANILTAWPGRVAQAPRAGRARAP